MAFAQPSQAALPAIAQIQPFFNGSGQIDCIQTNPFAPGTGVQLVDYSCNLGSATSVSWFPLINGGNYNIVNQGNAGCMDAVTNTDGGVVETFPCTGISNQRWSFNPYPGLGNDYYQIISHVAGGNRCLEDTVNMTIHTCNVNNLAQAFKLVQVGG